MFSALGSIIRMADSSLAMNTLSVFFSYNHRAQLQTVIQCHEPAVKSKYN